MDNMVEAFSPEASQPSRGEKQQDEGQGSGVKGRRPGDSLTRIHVRILDFGLAAEIRSSTVVDAAREQRIGRHQRNAASPDERNEDARAGEQKTVRVGLQTVNLRWGPSGTFTMSSPSCEEGRSGDETITA